MKKLTHSFRFVMLTLLVYLGAVSCDTSTDPPIDHEPCQEICDTLAIENRDSSVVLSLDAISSDYIVMGVGEFAVFYNEYVAVYQRSTSRVVTTLPYGSAEYKSGRVLYSDPWGIKEYNIESDIHTPIIQGYIVPSYCSDSSRLLLRRIGASYIYSRVTGAVAKLTDADNIREYRDGRFVLYDNGFFVFDTSTGTTEPLEISGFPEKMSAVRYPDWDLDERSNTMVVHTPVVNGNLEDNRLYVVDLNSRIAHRVLGRSDGDYTPRFSSDSDLYVVRTCQTSRESYIIKVDPETGCERVVVTAWMNAEGVTEFTKEDK